MVYRKICCDWGETIIGALIRQEEVLNGNLFTYLHNMTLTAVISINVLINIMDFKDSVGIKLRIKFLNTFTNVILTKN